LRRSLHRLLPLLALQNAPGLVAYGIGLDGHRQLLAVTIGFEESEASWNEFLTQLLSVTSQRPSTGMGAT